MARIKSNNFTANLEFEAKLWLAADSRSRAETAEGNRSSNMDAAEYKHTVLDLIFLKYISDSFDEHHTKLLEGQGDYAGARVRRLRPRQWRHVLEPKRRIQNSYRCYGLSRRERHIN